jgi:hypothetical protein
MSPADMSTEHIVSIFKYRCRLQLANLSAAIADRLWQEQQIPSAFEVDRMRRLERQSQRRHYQALRRDPVRLRAIFVAGAKATAARMGMHLAGGGAVVYLVYLWAHRA